MEFSTIKLNMLLLNFHTFKFNFILFFQSRLSLLCIFF